MSKLENLRLNAGTAETKNDLAKNAKLVVIQSNVTPQDKNGNLYHRLQIRFYSDPKTFVGELIDEYTNNGDGEIAANRAAKILKELFNIKDELGWKVIDTIKLSGVFVVEYVKFVKQKQIKNI